MDPKAYREETLSRLRRVESFGASEDAQEKAGIEDVDALIESAADTSLPVKVRLAALHQINQIAFDLRAFKDHNAQYDRELKKLRSDKSSLVRRAAFERLASSMDHETRTMLQDSLSGAGKSVVPDKLAATLLGMDDHASSRDVLREAIGRAQDGIREVALRGLAADAGSAKLLERIALNSAEPMDIREAAILSLKTADPARFADLVQLLATDRQEDALLRATAVSSLAHSKEALSRAQSQFETFISELDAVSQETTSRALKASIKHLKSRVK